MDVNILEDIGIIKKYYYTNLNELITSSRFITYSFYPNGSRRYQLSVDKVRGEEMPYLRVVGKNGDLEDVVITPIEHNDRWYYMLDAAELGFTDEPVTLVRYTMDSDDITTLPAKEELPSNEFNHIRRELHWLYQEFQCQPNCGWEIHGNKRQCNS